MHGEKISECKHVNNISEDRQTEHKHTDNNLGGFNVIDHKLCCNSLLCYISFPTLKLNPLFTVSYYLHSVSTSCPTLLQNKGQGEEYAYDTRYNRLLKDTKFKSYVMEVKFTLA